MYFAIPQDMNNKISLLLHGPVAVHTDCIYRIFGRTEKVSKSANEHIYDEFDAIPGIITFQE